MMSRNELGFERALDDRTPFAEAVDVANQIALGTHDDALRLEKRAAAMTMEQRSIIRRRLACIARQASLIEDHLFRIQSIDEPCRAERIRRAAPDLLEACREMAEFLRDNNIGMIYANKGFAAITKATRGHSLRPHDGVAEWSVCGQCGRRIDWANLPDDGSELACPYCGSSDTDWLEA
jgi:hypothetical protein